MRYIHCKSGGNMETCNDIGLVLENTDSHHTAQEKKFHINKEIKK